MPSDAVLRSGRSGRDRFYRRATAPGPVTARPARPENRVTMTREWMRRVLIATVTCCLALPLAAQGWRRMQLEPNVPYDGRFTFVRVRYQVHGRSGWEFDYPDMERNLMAATRELTS